MIWVDVHLFGYIVRYSPTGKETFRLELDSEATISELLAKIQFPSEVERVVLVNGHQANFSTRLADGDEVFIFVPVAGG
jgi:molybdopterin converting factor small subunit